MARIKVIVRKRNLLSNGGYPLNLRIAHKKWQTTYIRLSGLNVFSDEEFIESISRFSKKREGYRELNSIIDDIEFRAENIIGLLESKNEFTYENFKLTFLKKKSDMLVLDYFKQKIEALYRTDKVGTALIYGSTRKAFEEFTYGKQITFIDITFGFLKKWEEQRKIKKNSGNTIFAYMKTLRSLHYHFALENDIPKPTVYQRFNVGRLATETAKRGFTQDSLKKFMEYKTKPNAEVIAKDLWSLSLLTRGMNLTDIAYLKPINISDGKLTYRRAKVGTIITVNVNNEIQSIINKYSGESKLGYLFPIIKKGMITKISIMNFNRLINVVYKRIATKIEIPPFSFYSARHTWASLARENGISIELISAGLAHSNMNITKIYLKGFASNKLDDITTTILDNINNNPSSNDEV